MKLKITEGTIIYIMAPANIDTGGPHDLHQLGYELKNLGKKVFMYYFPNDQKNPVHENYKTYDLAYTTEIEDLEKNILIIPEINQTILLSRKYRNIQKAIWWLSLDYYFVSKFINKEINFKQLNEYIYRYSLNKNFMKFRNLEPKNIEEIYKIRDSVCLKLDTLSI